VHLPTLENGGSFRQILPTPVGTGADHRLVDGHLPHLAQRPCIRRQVREGHHRFDSRRVDLDHLRVRRPGVGSIRAIRPHSAPLDVLFGFRIHLEEPGLGARFDGHVRHGEAIVHGEGVDGFPHELDDLVPRPIDADEPDGVQDQVLATDPGAQPAMVSDTDRLWHAHPDAARGHGHGDVRRTHAGGKGAHGSIRASVRICADHDVPGQHQTLLGQEGMLDPHPPDLKVVRDPIVMRELAHCLALLRRLDVLVRSKVIRYERDALAIKNVVDADLGELLNGDRRRDVVRQHHVHPRVDEFSHVKVFPPGVGGKDLLRHSHGRPVAQGFLPSRTNTSTSSGDCPGACDGRPTACSGRPYRRGRWPR